MKKILTIIAMAVIGGCAVPLTPEAEKVGLVTVSQKEKCERIKLITFNQRLGTDKPGNAMKHAMNEAAAAGATSFYLVSTSTDWIEGATVVGEALRCPS